jgi:hypothetical protein
LLLLPVVSQAEDDGEPLPNAFTLLVIGSMNVTPPGNDYDNQANSDKTGYEGQILADYRLRQFSFETGFTYSKTAWNARFYDDTLGPQSQLVDFTAVGVPVILKWHYVEKTLATFFIKAGASLNAVTSRTDNLLVPAGYGAVIAGFGGSAHIGDTSALVLDITAVQDVGFSVKIRPQGLIGFGFQFLL